MGKVVELLGGALLLGGSALAIKHVKQSAAPGKTPAIVPLPSLPAMPSAPLQVAPSGGLLVPIAPPHNTLNLGGGVSETEGSDGIDVVSGGASPGLDTTMTDDLSNAVGIL